MNLPDYQTFLSPDRMKDFWKIVKWFLFFTAPVVMIFFALEALGELINRVIKGIKGGVDNDNDDDDDDEEYY